ncbi:MAG TPA: hypothetical protein VK929_06095 [Longimicrobiales bacterium]|nr:hypothetical protein [Longimicrobiales bacterium]
MKEGGEKDARNQGLKEEEKRLRDPEERPPHSEVDDGPAETGKRPAPAEKSEADVANLENPPQTEGPRERGNDGV